VSGNEDAFRAFRLRPRVLTDVSDIDTSVRVFGRRLAAPVLLAPTALHTMVHPGGERATAAAATGMGVAMTISTFAATTIEDAGRAAADPGLVWQQVYVFRDRGLTAEMIDRAEAAGAGAIVVTVDSPWLGRRLRDLRNDFRVPAWVRPANLAASLPEAPDISSPSQHSAQATDPTLTWDDIDELAHRTRLPVLVKGVLTGEDAKHAVDAGAAGIIVSNHGGRQLDRVVPTLFALPEVVFASSGVPVFMDGGVRSGEDVLIALALGATAVLIGRPALWGLAVGGHDGVQAVLSLLISELRNAMGHAGRPCLRDVDASLITAAVPDPYRRWGIG
jgi:isopentenyl diphosphate isomerase/L-lactate dehydrogenase-like FMN-dependent dehydrogenase